MKNWMLVLLAIAIYIPSFAQSAAEMSDPKAKIILDQLRTQYESYETLQVSFSLEIEIPEQDTEIQKGKILQQGEQYNINLDDQAFISDGKTLWVHLKNNNEVQINDVDPDDMEGVLSPDYLLRVYEQEDFIYALTNEYVEKERSLQQIEFKPTDPDSEYSKLRLTIDKNAKEIISMKAFGKDGSRFTINVSETVPNKPIGADSFIFDKSKYPGIHIEDLRI